SAGRLPLFANIGAAQVDPAYLAVGAAGATARALNDAATRNAAQRLSAGVLAGRIDPLRPPRAQGSIVRGGAAVGADY
ncbi:MAG: hypothetical protein AAGG56_18900, partial [Pseudomonadota bacterium]